MGERKTISESKGIFHKEFPYVIPSIYRKVIDEYIVELNLLKNQKNFKEDYLFSYGLVKSYEIFTQGYQPKAFLNNIFISLCKSADIEVENITRNTEQIKIMLKGFDNFKSFNDSLEEGKALALEINKLYDKKNYYSRIHTIGIYELIRSELDTKLDKKECREKSLIIANKLGLKKERVDKDIALYQNNLQKINDAMELLKAIANNNK